MNRPGLPLFLFDGKEIFLSNTHINNEWPAFYKMEMFVTFIKRLKN